MEIKVFALTVHPRQEPLSSYVFCVIYLPSQLIGMVLHHYFTHKRAKQRFIFNPRCGFWSLLLLSLKKTKDSLSFLIKQDIMKLKRYKSIRDIAKIICVLNRSRTPL